MMTKHNRLTFWVYRDRAGKWRWRLRAGNGKILADSGQSYQHKTECLEATGLIVQRITFGKVAIKCR